jgi:hypothetical protein
VPEDFAQAIAQCSMSIHSLAKMEVFSECLWAFAPMAKRWSSSIREMPGTTKSSTVRLKGKKKKCSQSESGSFLDVTVPFPLTQLRIFWSSRLMGGFIAEMRSGLEPRLVHGRWSERRGVPQKSSRKGNLKIKSM